LWEAYLSPWSGTPTARLPLSESKKKARTSEIPLPGTWVKAVPLAPRKTIHVETGQRSGAAGSSGLQGLELVHSLVETSGEMGFVSSYLLQGLLVRQQALPAHVP
jgi:hypothetical protein